MASASSKNVNQNGHTKHSQQSRQAFLCVCVISDLQEFVFLRVVELPLRSIFWLTKIVKFFSSDWSIKCFEAFVVTTWPHSRKQTADRKSHNTQERLSTLLIVFCVLILILIYIFTLLYIMYIRHSCFDHINLHIYLEAEAINLTRRYTDTRCYAPTQHVILYNIKTIIITSKIINI